MRPRDRSLHVCVFIELIQLCFDELNRFLAGTLYIVYSDNMQLEFPRLFRSSGYCIMNVATNQVMTNFDANAAAYVSTCTTLQQVLFTTRKSVNRAATVRTQVRKQQA